MCIYRVEGIESLVSNETLQNWHFEHQPFDGWQM